MKNGNHMFLRDEIPNMIKFLSFTLVMTSNNNYYYHILKTEMQIFKRILKKTSSADQSRFPLKVRHFVSLQEPFSPGFSDFLLSKAAKQSASFFSFFLFLSSNISLKKKKLTRLNTHFLQVPP